MFEDIIKLNNGANFYLADLHIHTPIWPHIRLPSGLKIKKNKDKKELAKKYIEKAIEKGIKILGITEHNDLSWIDYIRKAAENTELVIFPGFEIASSSGSDGIHLLCLFVPNTEITYIDRILSKLLPPQRYHNGKPRNSDKPFEEILSIVKEHNGICIAAHSTRENGLLKSAKGENRIKFFTNPNLLAIEIPKSKEKLGEFEKNIISGKDPNYRRKYPIACVNFSDAKSIDEIGKKATYIKLSAFTVEGLRQAFLDWESRIRLQDEVKEHLFSKIIAIKWEGGFLDGNLIHFNNNLNCIIGGKGTGKSTIVETIRYAFDIKPHATKIEEQYNELLEAAFKSGSKISILIESHYPSPKKYIIERSKPGRPIVLEEDGTPRPDLKPTDIFNLEIFSQKEIYEISKDPSFQLRLIDKFIENKLDKLREEEKEILDKLEENKNDILETKKQIIRREEKISHLPKLKEDLEKFKKLGIPDKLSEKKIFETEKHLFERAIEDLKNLQREISKFIEEKSIKYDYLLEENIQNLRNKKILQDVHKIIKNLSEKVNQNFTTIVSEIKTSLNQVKTLKKEKWEPLYEKQNENYHQILLELQKSIEFADPNEYIEIEKKINQLKPLEGEKNKFEKKLGTLEKERITLLNQLEENRRKQFQVRNKVVEELNEKLEGILQILLEYQGEKYRFLEKLKELRSGAHIEQLKKIIDSKDFSIPKFVESVRKGPEDLTKTFGITSSTATNLCKAITPEVLFEIETFQIPTRTIISLNVGSKEKPKYKETKSLSVGQKCTAILTLILLESPYPLIIDQPEDDLDNKFVFEDIVQKLRKEKEKRQFIIATHNANIPVLGDAELIIVLSASDKNGYVENNGSIDDERLREPVEKILEGGKQAFELRKIKYGF